MSIPEKKKRMATHPCPAQANGRQAFVIGGSIAGLLTARALADYYPQVTVIERDRLPDGPAPRPGIPQARHSHGISKLLQTVGEHWFPGLAQELLAAGAVLVDAAREFCWFAPAALPKPAYPLPVWISCSRTLAEWHIRQRVASLPNIRFVEAMEVVGLLPSADGRRIAGVELRQRGSHSVGPTSTVQLSPALIVDASGRHSKASRWLAAIDFPTPDETMVINRPYRVSSCLCTIPANFADGWKQLTLIPETIEQGWTISVQQIEDGKWIIGLTTSGAERLPTQRAEFLHFLRGVSHPLLAPYFANIELCSPVAGGGHTANLLRHYDQLSRQPDNFIVLGDAMCSFHPGYGAGMQIAAQECLALADCLEEQRTADPASEAHGFARRFQQRIASIIASQWAIETAEGHG